MGYLLWCWVKCNVKACQWKENWSVWGWTHSSTALETKWPVATWQRITLTLHRFNSGWKYFPEIFAKLFFEINPKLFFIPCQMTKLKSLSILKHRILVLFFIPASIHKKSWTKVLIKTDFFKAIHFVASDTDLWSVVRLRSSKFFQNYCVFHRAIFVMLFVCWLVPHEKTPLNILERMKFS